MKIAINDSAKAARLWPCAEAGPLPELLGILLADVETDISVAARDLGISVHRFFSESVRMSKRKEAQVVTIQEDYLGGQKTTTMLPIIR
jgi:hypothetical protein